MSAPLEGIRVVEIASFVAAPSGGALLADLGAEVVKVEVPEGEIYRHTKPHMGGYKSDFDGGPPLRWTTGQAPLALDLTRPRRRGALRRTSRARRRGAHQPAPRPAAEVRPRPDSLHARRPALIHAT
jgi:crotonobetainyl-CoA:carnitine CoA-transferase CaiB-like acyl-CoA transferase